MTAVFDADSAKVGRRLGDVIIKHTDELERTVADQHIRIGVIAVPPEAAQDVADRLVFSGIGIILNYTPTIVRVPAPVLCHNSDPVQELLHTLYYLSQIESGVASA